MGSTKIEIFAVINGRTHTRDEVLAWEAERMPRAAKKIGLPTPTGNLEHQRLAFADSKIALGAEETKLRLARDLKLSELTAKATTKLARGKRTVSICDLHVAGGDAAEFVQWFGDAGRDDYVRSMVAANPDHFLIQAAPDGTQEVIETTGGSPLASRFFVDYTDLSTLRSPSRTEFTAEAAGVALTGTGLPIGGVRHQFRNEPEGFHAHLRVEFPRYLAPHMIAQHRWHLATEFSNWIEFAFTGLG